jgi:DNA-directed RNA polymerase subunit RPC12/RpoP
MYRSWIKNFGDEIMNCPHCNADESEILFNHLADKIDEDNNTVIVNHTVYSDYHCMNCDSDFNNEDLKDII